jgi:hypothetical protein
VRKSVLVAEQQTNPGCIYCGRTDFADEHWLPRSFGSFNYDLLKTTICTTCNTELGRTIDMELIRSGPEGVARALLGVEGRHGSSQSPVYYKAATTQPVRLNIVGDENAELFIEPFHKDGKGGGKPARQIQIVGGDGEQRYLLLNLKWDPDTLSRMVDSLNLREPRLTELYCEPDEVTAARALLSIVFPGFTAQAYARDGESAQRRMRGEFRLATPYFRGLVKIGFHYAIAHTRWIRGDEPEFGVVRDFIRHGIGNPWFFIEDATGKFSFVPSGQSPRRWAHFLAVDADERGMLVRLQLFVGPGFPAFPWVINLTSKAVTAVPHARGHVAVYFDERLGPSDGELVELEVRDSVEPDVAV